MIELKTIDACKDEVAKNHGYKDFLDVLFSDEVTDIRMCTDEAMKAYGEHLCDYIAENADYINLIEFNQVNTFKAVKLDSILSIKDKIR